MKKTTKILLKTEEETIYRKKIRLDDEQINDLRTTIEKKVDDLAKKSDNETIYMSFPKAPK